MSGHITELIDALALGELDEKTSELVRAHLARCATCRADVNDVRAVMDVLPNALEPVKPHERVFQNILLGSATDRAPARRHDALWIAPLAACLALALIGDGILGFIVAARGKQIVVAVASPRPAPTVRRVPPLPVTTRPVVAAPSPIAQRPRAHAARGLPLAAPLPAATVPLRVATAPPAAATVVPVLRTHPSAATTADTQRLVRARDKTIEALRVLATQDAGRIAELQHRLAQRNGPAPREAALVAALQTGGVYSVSGTVDGEAWHCTVLQSSPAANAVLLTRAPSAPPGENYRVWVVRDRQTLDAGAIVPHADTTLEMPMPLVAGDVVAFSREPQSTGKLPTQPYLMKIPISN